VSRMTDNRMKVSLRMVFTMISNSNVQPLHKGFVVKLSGQVIGHFGIVVIVWLNAALLAAAAPMALSVPQLLATGGHARVRPTDRCHLNDTAICINRHRPDDTAIGGRNTAFSTSAGVDVHDTHGRLVLGPMPVSGSMATCAVATP
jgi:hypothetical protein